MQHISNRVVSLIALMLCSFAGMAQKDTIYRNYKDTFYSYKLSQARLDSFRKKINIERRNYTTQGFKKDSLKRFYTLSDTLRHFTKMRSDTAFKRVIAERKKLNAANKIRRDTAFSRLKMERKFEYALERYKMTDSGFKKFERERLQQLDVQRKYLQNLRTDSVQMKKYLKYKRDTAYLKFDSLQRGKKYISKEIAMQISCKPGAILFIKNANRNVIVRKGNSKQINVSLTINYTEDEKFNDAQWFKKLNISLEKTDSGIVVMARNLYGNALPQVNKKRAITIEIPENISITVETENAVTQVENNIDKLTAVVSSGTLKIQNVNDININAKYSTVRGEVFKKADITLASSKFSASMIDQLIIDSKYSTVNINDTKDITIKSSSDQYNLDNVYAVTGKKDFGKFNISTLNGNVDLKGANTDVKVNTITDNTVFIKIDSRYADLRFPVYDLSAYDIKYEGSSKSVSNVYSATQKGTGTATITVNQNVSSDTTKNVGKVNQTFFEASAGSANGKRTKADIKCAFCTVAFQ